MQKISPLIKPDELARLMNREKPVLIDARTGPDAKKRYKAGHLENALFADLEKDLAKKTANPAEGGRHPLPGIQEFTRFIGTLGIDKSTYIVVYDDKNGANAAARFWWMMRALGHNKVQVLNGGLKAALDAGFILSDTPVIAQPKPGYPADEWQLPIVDANDVARATSDPSQLVIDVREAFRYRGESEPIDAIAGHIPGAVNIPYAGNLEENGEFLSKQELEKKYKDVIGDRDPKKVIVHCGSGVTACHTLLAMDEAGLDIPNLYVGSWSEWSRNERPVTVEVSRDIG